MSTVSLEPQSMNTPTDYFALVWIATIASIDITIILLAIATWRSLHRNARNKKRDTKRESYSDATCQPQPTQLPTF